jgi:hypothetical protein
LLDGLPEVERETARAVSKKRATMGLCVRCLSVTAMIGQFRDGKSTGSVGRRHKHLAPAHVFCLAGKLRHNDTDAIVSPGDYSYEPAGAIHGATTALEDNVHLIFQLRAVVHLDADDNPCGYHGREAMEAIRGR